MARRRSRDRLIAGARPCALPARVPSGGAESLAATAEEAGLAGAATADAGLAVRHWLEADGDRRLIVFDSATDADALRRYVPAGGAARVLITSNRQSVANLGAASVPVDVFTLDEALAFLAERTGLADPAGAREVAAELGYLPLALAQAAAVIAAQHLPYSTYLDRLRALPVGEYLTREQGQPYPYGVAQAVLLSLDAVRAGDRSGLSIRVMELMAVLSAAGVRRDLLHDAGRTGVLAGRKRGRAPKAAASMVDESLAQLADRSLLTFNLDGRAVTAHRLILRVIRESLTRQGRFKAVCRAAISGLDKHAGALMGSQDRVAFRDVPEQVMALLENMARLEAETDDDQAKSLLNLRLWALFYLIKLGDSAQQAILVGESLIADCERILGPDHQYALDARDRLAGAYLATGRTVEAVPLSEQVLADSERVLGPDHPDILLSRGNLAFAYYRAGRYAEAIPLSEQAVADSERVLGPDHPPTLLARNNLAAAYRDAGRYAEAIPLSEQAVADSERVLGPDHPQTLVTRDNLAAVYREADLADAVHCVRS